MKWVVPVSTCPIKGKPYRYTIMHCDFILVASFFTSIFNIWFLICLFLFCSCSMVIV